MRVALFCHTLASCWNHGNAHFLRGVARDLARRGHEVRAFEPADGWSRENLVRDHGADALAAWRAVYPELASETYRGLPDLDAALDGAGLVLVHEWTAPEVVAALGMRRKSGARFTLLFHDTHHRAATEAGFLWGLDLDGYDGVLAFGASLRERYLRAGWGGDRVRVWHEAADATLFRPLPEIEPEADLAWIGNWGDGERSAELRAFLFEPVRRLGLAANVWGVRYPEDALAALEGAGIAYHGWLPNVEAPAVFARHRVTVHVPRRPYAKALPGIPTIRVFEALACGIPLVSGPWDDAEGLFPKGAFLMAEDGEAMEGHLKAVLRDGGLRRHLIDTGLKAIHARHTCRHRVDELLAIVDGLRGEGA
ncbi:MAG: glycosyltransferase [Geminicoccaceae bacterium]|nr:glycosyltransferase [Geminicoccaceae bacterium]